MPKQMCQFECVCCSKLLICIALYVAEYVVFLLLEMINQEPKGQSAVLCRH